ncbi:MAG: hypothetical protein MK240_11910, partial [Opitutales bacterium]|nr:hypothetical protein [Opitutales bacterium]
QAGEKKNETVHPESLRQDFPNSKAQSFLGSVGRIPKHDVMMACPPKRGNASIGMQQDPHHGGPTSDHG